MKTKLSLLIACILMSVTGFAAITETIDGNGNVITKEISISDYNEISTSNVMEFVYEQSDAAPFLQITIDENLFPYLQAQVDGKELKVYPKKKNDINLTGKNYNLNPTTFKVVTNSRVLKELNVATPGQFIIAGPLNISKLEINMAGSGSVIAEKRVTGNKMEVNMAGSGEVKVLDIDLTGVECSMAGSGHIRVGGKADRAEYNMAGSGSIKAGECSTTKAECNLTGSGTVEANVREHIEANIVGSGHVYYKGDPTTSKSIIGSGKLKQAN